VRYVVHLTTTASTSVVVEAENKADAIEQAACGDLPTLCAHCAGFGQEGRSLDLSGEWDAKPEDVYPELAPEDDDDA
jgi:hypothetical protein